MMQASRLQAELTAMSAGTGLAGCALVDASTGLIWCSTGELQTTPLIAEAACDYWRLYLRNREYFQSMGEIRAQVLIHSEQRLTLVGFDPDLLLIAQSNENTRIDWRSWQVKIREFQALVSKSLS
jgi:hypothetical protein